MNSRPVKQSAEAGRTGGVAVVSGNAEAGSNIKCITAEEVEDDGSDV